MFPQRWFLLAFFSAIFAWRIVESSQDSGNMVVMAVGPTGVGKSSLLNALLCPTKYTRDDEDCHFETGQGVNSVTDDIEWRE